MYVSTGLTPAAPTRIKAYHQFSVRFSVFLLLNVKMNYLSLTRDRNWNIVFEFQDFWTSKCMDSYSFHCPCLQNEQKIQRLF